jgi:hypothetical protein
MLTGYQIPQKVVGRCWVQRIKTKTDSTSQEPHKDTPRNPNFPESRAISSPETPSIFFFFSSSTFLTKKYQTFGLAQVA